jgi:hypothetical protein
MKASSLITTNKFSFFKYSNPRGVPRKRCSGFLVILGLKEMANIER